VVLGARPGWSRACFGSRCARDTFVQFPDRRAEQERRTIPCYANGCGRVPGARGAAAAAHPHETTTDWLRLCIFQPSAFSLLGVMGRPDPTRDPLVASVRLSHAVAGRRAFDGTRARTLWRLAATPEIGTGYHRCHFTHTLADGQSLCSSDLLTLSIVRSQPCAPSSPRCQSGYTACCSPYVL